ncbi:MAG: ferredoxin [Actinomycetota bacterium]|nr:ferredoxin [Actinomycetota bacterium]
MRVEVDSRICEGHGQCYEVAEDVYDLDEDGYALVRESSRDAVPPELEEQARDGAAACPVQAITIYE